METHRDEIISSESYHQEEPTDHLTLLGALSLLHPPRAPLPGAPASAFPPGHAQPAELLGTGVVAPQNVTSAARSPVLLPGRALFGPEMLLPASLNLRGVGVGMGLRACRGPAGVGGPLGAGARVASERTNPARVLATGAQSQEIRTVLPGGRR